MARCTFCRGTVPPGTGTTFFKNDGKSFIFCSSKCERNQLKLKRVARTTAWTGPAIKEKKLKTEQKKSKA